MGLQIAPRVVNTNIPNLWRKKQVKTQESSTKQPFFSSPSKMIDSKIMKKNLFFQPQWGCLRRVSWGPCTHHTTHHPPQSHTRITQVKNTRSRVAHPLKCPVHLSPISTSWCSYLGVEFTSQMSEKVGEVTSLLIVDFWGNSFLNQKNGWRTGGILLCKVRPFCFESNKQAINQIKWDTSNTIKSNTEK